MKFFNLSSDDRYKEVEYSEGTDWESIKCPVYDGHQRAGKRIGNMRINIIEKRNTDFLWTFLSECLVTDKTAKIFKEAGFTGFELKTVQVINKNAYPLLWEFYVTGKGGDVSLSNGISVKNKCDHCKHIHYSSFGNGLIIDDAQWDGSDFFTVWPLPRFILITERVKTFIVENKLSNVKIKPVEELIGNGKDGGLSPGNYDNWIKNTW